MKPLKQLFTWTLGLGTLFFSASAFATLRITEICPRPDALDPNGKEGGWIELTNLGDEAVNLKDYALIRWNRGKEDKKKNRRVLCDRVLQPGERTLVYTSEAYPNYWDGEKVTVYDNDVMVFPSKVNPKKFPNVALYRVDTNGKDDVNTGEVDSKAKPIYVKATKVETFIVPVDLEDDKSFGPGDAYNRRSVMDETTEYTYQLGDGESQTGAGRLTVSTTQLPSDVAGRVEVDTLTVDSAVTVLENYTNSKDTNGVIQANAYDFSAMDAGNKGVKVTPSSYPEGMYAVSFWFRSKPSEVKVNTNTTGNGMPLFESRPSGDGNRSGMMLFINDDDQLTLQPRNASGTSTTLATIKTYADNLWHHAVIVSGQKLGEKVTLYVDGIAEIQAELGIDCELQSTIPYCFGHAYNSTSWHTYKGQIADIRLFNREVSATEVAQLREENAASRNVTNQYGGLETKTDETAKKYLTYKADTDTYTFAVVGAGDADYLSNVAYVENHEQSPDLLCLNGETLAFWVKPSSFSATGKEAMVLMDSRVGSGNTEGYLFLYGTDTSKNYGQKLYIQRGSAKNFVFNVENPLTIGEWTHLALSIDATTEKATLYINGAKVATQTVVGYAPCTGDKKTRRFGGTHDKYWRGFRGDMAEINIFSGVLPSSEIVKFYNASSLTTKVRTSWGDAVARENYHKVDKLPVVKGSKELSFTATENEVMIVSASALKGKLEVTWNNEPITLDSPISVKGESEGTLAWTLTASDENATRLLLALEADLATLQYEGETRAIMPKMTPGEANDYTNAIAYGPNIGPSNTEVFEDFGYYLPKPMATRGEAFTEDFMVVLDVHPIAADDSNAIAKVELMYRTGFGEPKYVTATYTEGVFQRTVEEEDENGDEVEVDKMFAGYVGVIPAEDIPANGQLIQFGARITDGAGRRWISPSRNNPDDCPLWYGTIVEPNGDQKAKHEQLQTFHLFVENRYLPGGSGPSMDQDYDKIKDNHPLGARVGIYDAQTDTYYDNVRIDLRGNTSADFPKKSHGLRFSKCQPLTCKNVLEGTKLKEIRKSSFTAEYADPTFIRQSLSFHVWRNAGNKVPFHYPVRLNLNGEFYQLAFHSNRFTDELIEDYYGLDPMGYGYKNVGTISPNVGTTAGSVEKKTPDDGNETGKEAYKPLADWAKTFSQSEGCPENDATLNGIVYDTFDIPAWINYLATARITQECDDIWANICLYWDKNGNDVWMPLAYDHNLSFGAWYYGDDRALGRIGLRPADDTFKSHPFYSGWKIRARAGGEYDGTTVGPGGNYAVEALWQNPEIRQMYLRRLRTLMDEHLKEPGTEQKDTPFWKDYVNLFKEVTLKDAELDRKKWGYPDLTQDGKGEEIYVWEHANWDDPKIEGWDNNLAFEDMWDKYVVLRRDHLYETHAAKDKKPEEIGYGQGLKAGIPEAHPETFAPILMEKVEGGVKLTNPNTDSIDLSGWTVEGLMDVSTLPEDSEDIFTLPPGTVLLGGKSLVLAYDRKTYVANNEPCFVIGLAVYGDDKTWIPDPNTKATSIVLKKANGDIAVDNVLPEGIADWLYGAIEAGTVTAADLAEVTAAADYEFACLVNEAPVAEMEAKTKLDISNIMIDENGDVILTATLFVNNKGKNGELNGVVKLYSKATLADDWTEDNIEFNTFSDGAVTLPPVGTGILRSATKPCFFQMKLTK